jgi:hypothetical protein
MKMPNPSDADAGSSTLLPAPPSTLSTTHRNYFVYCGMGFLIVAAILFLCIAWTAYDTRHLPHIEVPSASDGIDRTRLPADYLPTRDWANYVGRILEFVIMPLFLLVAAIVCTFVGMRLLKSSGAVTTQVIAPQDYPVLGPAIAAGNENAITQFIRLSSLSGVTGTFTKVGLTGLPLATIALTLLLGFAGLYNAQFFDLAKLTLGAFLGSFVQRAQPVENARQTTPVG